MMLSESQIDTVKSLAGEGKWTSYIEKVLNIRKGSLKNKIKDLDVRNLLIHNTQIYTNSNIRIRHWRSLSKLIKLTNNYGSSITLLLKNKSCGLNQISKKLGISTREVQLITSRLGLLNELKINNKVCKGAIIKKRFFNATKLHTEDIITKYSNDIIKDVLNGYNYIRLRKKYNLSMYKLRLILSTLKLESTVKSNSDKILQENRIIASKKGAAKVRGTKIIRHPLTQKMKNEYLKFVKLDIVDSKARSVFFEKFGTAGPHTWDGLQSMYGILRKNPSRFLPGELNKMFGKEPSKNAGIGIKGHLYAFGELIHFRSSLELRVYLYLIKNNIEFALSTHKIQYIKDNTIRNYHPDIVIGHCIYEIKPDALTKIHKNKIKFDALLAYAKRINLMAAYITYETYDLSEINLEYIRQEMQKGNIIMNESEFNRLSKNIK